MISSPNRQWKYKYIKLISIEKVNEIWKPYYEYFRKVKDCSMLPFKSSSNMHIMGIKKFNNFPPKTTYSNNSLFLSSSSVGRDRSYWIPITRLTCIDRVVRQGASVTSWLRPESMSTCPWRAEIGAVASFPMESRRFFQERIGAATEQRRWTSKWI